MKGPRAGRPSCSPGAASGPQLPPLPLPLLLLAGAAELACVGRTGGTAVDFPVMAAGPATATAGAPLACANDGPWTIVLGQASLHIGAVYLNQSQPVSGGQATDCYLPGTYVAQELSAIDVDLLSPVLAPFPTLAHGITEPPALVGQVWLTHGDVNTIPDPEPVLRAAGTATRAGAAFPFAAEISIGANRQGQGPGGTVAGGDPICKERIVTPIPAPITIAPSGALVLRVDPCRLFTNVDFSQLPPGSTPGTYAFSDDPTAPAYTQPSTNLYSNLRNTGPYAFSWAPDL
jgi:hypothetical protein